MARLFFILVLMVCIRQAGFAQSKDFILKNLSMEEGLPSEETYYVYQDSKNYIWFATDKGVARYNGNKMETFSLPDNVVFKIYEDSKGRVWFFSHTGRLSYCYNNTIYAYQYNPAIKEQIGNILITSACVDDKDNIHLNSHLFYNYTISNDGVVSKYLYNKPDTDTGVFDIKMIGDNKWFATNTTRSFVKKVRYLQINIQGKDPFSTIIPANGMQYGHYGVFGRKGGGWILFCGNYLMYIMQDGSTKVKSFANEILSAYLDADDNIWLGFHFAGAAKLDADLTILSQYDAIAKKSVTGITADFEGGLWFSTLENGIYYMKNEKVHRLITGVDYLSPVFRMCEPTNDTLIYGNAKGIFGLQGNNSFPVLEKPIKHIYDLKRTAYGYKIAAIFESNDSAYARIVKIGKPGFDQLLQARGNSELLLLKNGNYLSNESSSWLLELPENKLLKGIYSKDISTEIMFQSYFTFRSANDKIWIGTMNGLFVYDEQTSTPVSFKANDPLLSLGVTSMRQMDNGFNMLAIRFGGIAVMKDTTIIATITQDSGLLSNAIKYLLPVGNQLWVATDKGISIINFQSYAPLKYEIVNVGKPEGFYNVIINQLVLYKENVLAATNSGIYSIENVNRPFSQGQSLLPFYIRTISYYKGDTSAIPAISLPYNKNNMTIKYNAISFNDAEDLVYYYRFKRTDSIWRTTTSNELVLENLSPGIYDLEIKAAIRDKKRVSAIKALQIIIQKPWWQNNFLRLACFILICAVVYLFYQNRVDRIKQKENQKTVLKNKMTELENIALRSQMDPHFIFNSLSSIQQLVIAGNTEDANDYLVKFARLLRNTLELSANSFISLENEKEFLTEYLVLEQLRIPGQFEFTIHIGEGIDPAAVEIPHMIVQPIVENAIRHGMMPLENRKGVLSISFLKKNSIMYCIITDNGVGYNTSSLKNDQFFTKHKSFGMDIVRKRLKILQEINSEANSFEIKNLYDQEGLPSGTEVTMILPVKRNTI